MRLIDADEVDSLLEIYFTRTQALSRRFGSLLVSGMCDGYARARNIVLEQPTIDPVQHGRWIDDFRGFEEFAFFRKGWKCSACGSRNTYGKPKYCPNCGARMDGESNEMD